MFTIGDTVWVAGQRTKEVFETCPECFGKRFLTVILGDDSQVQIDCAGCSRGFDRPSGQVSHYETVIGAEVHTITGIEQRIENGLIKVTYRSSNFSLDEDRVFADKEHALAMSESLKNAHEQDEKNRYENLKHSRTRTWSWHVHYHRKYIRDLEKQMEYHKGKLKVSLEHSKEKVESPK